MKRINIIGTTGSGKSTFASALSDNLSYPYIQIDQIFWKPDWEETADHELLLKLAEAVSGDCWVLDGNYNRTNHIKWERADTIVWIDFGFIRTFLQLLKRTIVRAAMKQELWYGTGNKETFYRSFMSKKSILVWYFKSYRRNRSQYSALMKSDEYDHIKWYRLRTPREASKFLEEIRNNYH
jgi:adenylate kinase family enzyme